MRLLRSAAATALAVSALMLVGAQANAELAYDEIIEVLPGTWEIDPAELDPEALEDDAVNSMRCDRNPLSITIDETDEGLVYRGSFVGRDGDGHQSAVRHHPIAILLKYDNEDRTTPSGELVEWFLLMPDRDHHYWIRADWVESQPGARTGMFRRCPGPIS